MRYETRQICKLLEINESSGKHYSPKFENIAIVTMGTGLTNSLYVKMSNRSSKCLALIEKG